MTLNLFIGEKQFANKWTKFLDGEAGKKNTRLHLCPCPRSSLWYPGLGIAGSSGFSNDGADGRDGRWPLHGSPRAFALPFSSQRRSHISHLRKNKTLPWPRVQLAPYFSVLFHSTNPKKNSPQSVHFSAPLLLSRIHCNSSTVLSTPLNQSCQGPSELTTFLLGLLCLCIL